MYNYELEHYMIYSISKEKKYGGLAEVLSPQITKYWVHKSQIRKMLHWRKVREYNRLFKSAMLLIFNCGTHLRTTHLWYL
jgi:hypothetical protein